MTKPTALNKAVKTLDKLFHFDTVAAACDRTNKAKDLHHVRVKH